MGAVGEHFLGSQTIGNQKPGSNSALLPSSCSAGVIAESPEVVKAKSSLNRTASVLSNHRLGKRQCRPLLRDGNNKRCAEFPEFLINGDGGFRSKRHPGGTDGAEFGVAFAFLKKDVAWVLREGGLHLRRIGFRPGADALHRKLMRRQVFMRYQPLTDGVVSPAILICKAHSHEASIGKHNSA